MIEEIQKSFAELYDKGYANGYKDAKKKFDRPHGEWENGRCTNCGAECFEDAYMRDIETEFCHRCGADMQKEDEKE